MAIILNGTTGITTPAVSSTGGVGVGSVVTFPDNTDYQTFKKDIAEGKTLQDADGNEMTAEAAQEYLASLP
jgi:hypothetical protein